MTYLQEMPCADLKTHPHPLFTWIGLDKSALMALVPLGLGSSLPIELKDPHQLAMKLWVNDELMQDSNTNLLIFNIAEQIEALSQRITLHPGDLVLTGTPSGVGLARKLFLKPVTDLN
jgi:2-keto-4-pentenoate hydratase/2-oxohepta-3-ene-1,7-dioic acid hydratase in catechol pathway